MTKIIPLARCSYGTAKDQETDAATWERELSQFPDYVRHSAANMAAHNHDITLVGDKLLISCSWYNTQNYSGATGWYYKSGVWVAIRPNDYDKLYAFKQKQLSSDGSRSDAREHTINTTHLAE